MKNEPFLSEMALSDVFSSKLESESTCWGRVSLTKEFNFKRGRTDIIAVDEDGLIHAFELKLEKWSCALTQAYRSTSFADFSYIVVPENTAQRAMKSLDDFKKRSVGICAVGSDGVHVILPAVHTESIQPWLSASAVALAMNAAN
ncbi:MAG: hypothetical protein JKY87_07175 [Mariprofundus sp.]|nr:hypothetical protein [Mariprofundus sp.]